MKKAISSFFVVLGVLVFTSCVMTCVGGLSLMKEHQGHIEGDSILVLNLEEIIFENSDFLEDLKKFAKKDEIKGVLIQINSPGGVVGPSQEIYTELKRVRDELKKPVVVSGYGLIASGAYYAAMGASKIVTNPGTMIGSIGVIMSFANLENLYSWAKIKRYSITTGKFKDSGADYRPMRDDERDLFQNLIDEVHMQFKKAVAEGRGMDLEKVNLYADGRVMTGETAVRLGFADQIGTFEDARRLIGKLSGLGENPKTFKPPKHRPDFFELLEDVQSKSITGSVKKQLHLDLVGKPLYMMPGVF